MRNLPVGTWTFSEPIKLGEGVRGAGRGLTIIVIKPPASDPSQPHGEGTKS
jgi:hypothetical protein